MSDRLYVYCIIAYFWNQSQKLCKEFILGKYIGLVFVKSGWSFFVVCGRMVIFRFQLWKIKWIFLSTFLFWSFLFQSVILQIQSTSFNCWKVVFLCSSEILWNLKRNCYICDIESRQFSDVCIKLQRMWHQGGKRIFLEHFKMIWESIIGGREIFQLLLG